MIINKKWMTNPDTEGLGRDTVSGTEEEVEIPKQMSDVLHIHSGRMT